jgi:MFS transporter, DHA1 family, inner membrane transport protein
MFGNFVIGTGVLAPAGLLNDLSRAFAVDIAQVGTLIAYGAALLCIEAPLLAFATNRMDRRRLLLAALALYCAGHLASAFAPTFAALLWARLIMVAGAAVFTPQAASAITLFLPTERRSTAVAFIFLGWSLASAIGIPLVSLIGAHVGWSAAYLMLAVACAVASLAVLITVPRNLAAPPLSTAAWAQVLSSGKMWLILGVTALSLAGQFVEYPFIAADLKTRLTASPETIALLFAVYGVAGVAGALIATSAIGGLGAPATATLCVLAVLAGLVLWACGFASTALSAMALFVWGSGVGSANSAQQARLIAADVNVASASVALHTSSIYLGQGAGTLLGAGLLVAGYSVAIGWIAATLVGAALALSVIVRWRCRA